MKSLKNSSTEVLYFGYGSNLDEHDWNRYWAALGRRAPILEPVGPAVLPDHELAFDYYSGSRGGGALNVRRRVGQTVEGYLFRVSDAGWRGLDRKEGAAAGCYEPFETAALCSRTGVPIPIRSYRACGNRVGVFHQPTVAYLEACRRGRQRFGLGTAMLESAAKGEMPDSEVRGLFAYGTLMRGESRFPVVGRIGLKCALLARAFGDLYDRGAWPYMRLDGRPERQMVHGEFLIPHDLPSLLETCDAMEGFDGFDAPPRLFRRTLIDVDVDNGRIRRAWVYVLDTAHDLADLIPSGCWRRHQMRHTNFVRDLVEAHADGIEDFAHKVAVAITPPACMFDPERHDLTMAQVIDEVAHSDIAERRLAQVSERWNVVPSHHALMGDAK